MASAPGKQDELFPTVSETDEHRQSSGRQMRRYIGVPATGKHREPLLTVPEAAERCRLSVRQMWRHIREKRLRVVRLGSSVRIRPSDLERFINGEWE